MDLKQHILDNTDGGRIVFEHLFQYFHPTKSFKYDADEQTESCKAYHEKSSNTFYVKCYDPSKAPHDKACDCFDWWGHLRGISDFSVILTDIIAGITAIPSPGDFKISSGVKITVTDRRGDHTGFRKVLASRPPTESECKKLGAHVKPDHCKNLEIEFVQKYEFVKHDGTVLEFESSEHFPIFYFGPERKIYSPKEKEAKYRYAATEPMPEANTTVWNLDVLKKKIEKHRADAAEGDEVDVKKNISKAPGITGNKHRFDHVIFCCGCRDAVNVLSLGYDVVWMSSEGIVIPRKSWNTLLDIAHNIYYCGDIDETGKMMAHKNCETYLDLRRIYLPEDLKLEKDSRGKPKKDVTDWCSSNPPYAFEKLLIAACPYRFWTTSYAFNKDTETYTKKYKISRHWVKHFLQANGFFVYQFEDGKGFVRINGNMVEKVSAEDIKAWVNKWAIQRGFDREILDMISGTRDLSETVLRELPEANIEPKTFGHDFQIMVFKDAVWKIEPGDIKKYKHGKLDCFVWAHRTGLREHGQVIHPKTKDGRFDPDVISKKVQVGEKTTSIVDEFFTIDLEKSTITIHKNCDWFDFLINTCRIHWKDELQNWAAAQGWTDKTLVELQQLEIEKPGYKAHITSEYLSVEQNADQQKHLINRIFTLGYLAHRHKFRDKAWMVWCMDYTVEKLKDSKGRSGKSLIPQAFEHFKLISTENGRDYDLTKRPHVFEDVTSQTDLMVINDCHEHLNLGFFFNYITDNITVNPKNISRRIIPFDKTPKIIVTSNFGPNKLDESTLDRMLFNLFADYYHSEKNFGKEWKPSSTTGRQLFADWEGEEWKKFFNFMAQCCAWHFGKPKQQAPMDQVLLRQSMRDAGDTFMEFADDVLLPLVNPFYEHDHDDPTQGGLVDYSYNPDVKYPKGAYIIKKELMRVYREYSGVKESVSMNKLTDKVNGWAKARGVEVNPTDLFDAGGGGKIRVQRKVKINDKHVTVDALYLRSDKKIDKPEDPFEKELDSL